MSKTLEELVADFSVSMELTREDSLAAIKAFSGLGLHISPQAELLWRMNEWVNDRHPGDPVNWKGLR